MSPPIRFSEAQKRSRELRAGLVVHRTLTLVQKASQRMFEVGVDGPDVICDFNWRLPAPKPFFRRPHDVCVPMEAAIDMSEADYRDACLEALAMYAAFTEYKQVQRAFNRAILVSSARRPVKPVQGSEAYSRFLRLFRLP
jgi:hypothetical protein